MTETHNTFLERVNLIPNRMLWDYVFLLLELHALNLAEYVFSQAMPNDQWLTNSTTLIWLTKAEFKSD